ncbi:Gfo/Idh/MocA family protein [Flexithrix dorotheae]|uniref:Gfo/Idh/MocA family protein n=1 Tax=Flexithrix dorotheae TaxID=70993 RepID=UPI0012FC192C|nr:Gfo/Idh/MocA family oxidoreductase [Flexithrix dorotheae]
MKKSSLAIGGGVALSSLSFSKSVFASGTDQIKVGLVGCGGRGTGAAVQALKAGANIKLVAMADVFKEQLDKSYTHIMAMEEIKGQVEVPEKNKFVGFDGYLKVIQESDVVLLATPPGFRPAHFEASVDAGKHVFMEKPLACDGPGLRKVLATGKKATQKNLKVVVGLQNRYDPGYTQMVEQIKEGKIGEILSSTCYYMKGSYKVVPRSSVNSELAFQIKNWHFFNWLWGAAPAGLQIHNTDIVHWAKGAYPVSAQGMGGRAVLDGPDTGEVFDHFYIEYLYADGTTMHSQIRVMDNTWNKNGTFFIGSKGTANVNKGIKDLSGNKIWKYRDKENLNPYQIEHDKLFEAIVNDTPINDTEFGAKSSLAAIMGRMACHSGQVVTWEDCLNSEVKLSPDNMDWDTTAPILPDENGIYPVPKPGISKVY